MITEQKAKKKKKHRENQQYEIQQTYSPIPCYKWIPKIDQLLASELAKYLDSYEFKNKDKVQS